MTAALACDSGSSSGKIARAAMPGAVSIQKFSSTNIKRGRVDMRSWSNWKATYKELDDLKASLLHTRGR